MSYVRWLLVVLLCLVTAVVLTLSLVSEEKVFSQGPAPTPTLTGETAQDYLLRGLLCKDSLYDTPCAISDLTKAIELDPSLFDAYLARGDAYREVVALELALADYNRALELNPNSAAALVGRGQTKSIWPAYMEDFAQAQLDFARAIELDPSNSAALTGLGDYHLNMMENYDGAVAVYDQAIEANPNDGNAFYARGNAELVHYGYLNDIGIENWSRAIEILGDTPFGFYVQARLLDAQGKSEEGWMAIAGGLALYPNHAPLWSWAGQFVSPNPDQYADYAGVDSDTFWPDFYSRAAELAPMSPIYFTFRGSAMLDSGPSNDATFEAAVNDYLHALEISPAHTVTYYYLTRAFSSYATQRDCTRAAEYHELVLNGVVSQVEWFERALRGFEADYNQACGVETAPTGLLPVDNPLHSAGTEVTLTGFLFGLDSEPGAFDGAVMCTGGTTATVLQSVRLVADGPVFVQLECDAGTGWIAETLMPAN